MRPVGAGAPYDDRDDRALLAAHVAGDDEAFGTLFARHRERLWAVALRTTGDREEAADALQDALVSAFRRAGSYRGEAAVSTWLHRIVVNACLDRLRRARVRAADPLPPEDTGRASPEGGPGSGADAAARQLDPADLAVARERRDSVLAALAQLPPEQRAALVLVDMEGYSVEETAHVLGCPPGTVKSRCSRARARLVPLLGALVGNPAAGTDVEPGAESPDSPPGKEVTGHG